MSTILIVFIMVLTIFTWISTDRNVGEGQTDPLQNSYDLLELDRQMEENIGFIKDSLRYSTRQASGESALSNGRLEDSQESKYWVCKGNSQAPNISIVRNTLSEKTEEKSEKLINNIRGKRGQTIHEIGEVACVTAGYKKPRTSPENDNFKSYINVSEIKVSDLNQSLLRTKNKVKEIEEVPYNRYYYLHSILKKHSESNEFKEKVKNELKKIKDQGVGNNPICSESKSDCSYVEPFSCENKHQKWVREAVNRGISEELNRLESSKKYFNSNNVECSLEFNELSGADYPGVRISTNKLNKKPKGQSLPTRCKEDKVEKKYNETRKECVGGYEKVKDGTKQECDQNGCSEEPTYTKKCKKWNKTKVEKTKQVCKAGKEKYKPDCGRNYKCASSWYLGFDTYADFTVTCQDQKFSSIPKKELENLKWKYDVSFKVTENKPTGGTYTKSTCNNVAQPVLSYKPTNLRQCSYADDGKQVCHESGQLVGGLN